MSLNFTLCESNFFATSYYLEKISCRVFREAFLQWSARKWFGLLERWMYVVYDFIEGTGYLRSLSGVSIWTDDSVVTRKIVDLLVTAYTCVDCV